MCHPFSGGNGSRVHPDDDPNIQRTHPSAKPNTLSPLFQQKIVMNCQLPENDLYTASMVSHLAHPRCSDPTELPVCAADGLALDRLSLPWPLDGAGGVGLWAMVWGRLSVVDDRTKEMAITV